MHHGLPGGWSSRRRHPAPVTRSWHSVLCPREPSFPTDPTPTPRVSQPIAPDDWVSPFRPSPQFPIRVLGESLTAEPNFPCYGQRTRDHAPDRIFCRAGPWRQRRWLARCLRVGYHARFAVEDEPWSLGHATSHVGGLFSHSWRIKLPLTGRADTSPRAFTGTTPRVFSDLKNLASQPAAFLRQMRRLALYPLQQERGQVPCYADPRPGIPGGWD